MANGEELWIRNGVLLLCSLAPFRKMLFAWQIRGGPLTSFLGEIPVDRKELMTVLLGESASPLDNCSDTVADLYSLRV